MEINPFIAIFDFFKFFLENSYNFMKFIFSPLVLQIDNTYIKYTLYSILRQYGLENISIISLLTSGLFIFFIIKIIKQFKI